MSLMNILFISIAAPPKSGAESLQVGRYLKFITEHSSITLVTTPAMDRGWEKKDISQMGLLNNVEKVIYQKTLNSFGKWGNAVGRTLLKAQGNKPDDNFLFHFFPNRIINKLKTIPDLIYSRSAPFSSAVLGLKMKKLLNKPWCMHISDPWTDSPYVNYRTKYNVFLENSCFENADLISFTTPETLDFYSAKYPSYKYKFFITPNVFLPEDVNTDPVVFKHTKLTLLHTGNLYGKRNLSAIINALKCLNQDELGKIEVLLAGNMDQENLEMIKSSGITCIKNLGLISAEISLKLQCEADLLISIDKPLEVSVDRVFLPSKIQDYIAARKKILAITGKDSATYRIVQNEYGNCYDHQDIEGLSNFIRNSLKAFTFKNKNYFLMPLPSKQFNAQFNTDMLLHKFHQITSSIT